MKCKCCGIWLVDYEFYINGFRDTLCETCTSILRGEFQRLIFKYTGLLMFFSYRYIPIIKSI